VVAEGAGVCVGAVAVRSETVSAEDGEVVRGCGADVAVARGTAAESVRTFGGVVLGRAAADCRRVRPAAGDCTGVRAVR
jgi:hypothetical protein